MFEIYGRKNCSWCDAAKALLERKGLQYKYCDIEENKDDLEDFKSWFAGAKTVPQIMVWNKTPPLYTIIGGYSDLEKYIEVHY